MSAYTLGIGESEGSQDTPMRNTTPTTKRQREHKPRHGQPKKIKLNQCQTLAKGSILRRVWDDIYDQTFDKPSGKGEVDGKGKAQPIEEMDDDLSNEEAYIRDAKKENDKLYLLIQELQSKSKAAKQSNDHLDREVIANGITFGDPHSKPALLHIPDYDERRDDLVVEKCTKELIKRTDALQMARDSIERVRQQVQTFNGELRLNQAELAAQLDEMQLAYQSKLSQRECLVRRAQEEKHQVMVEATRAAENAQKDAIKLSNKLILINNRKEYYKSTAKSHSDEREDVRRQLDEKVAQLTQKDKLLESNREMMAGMKHDNREKGKALEQSLKTILETQNRVRELKREKTDRFTSWNSTAVKLRAKTSENERLTDRAASMEEELAEKRETVNEKVERIFVLLDSEAQLKERNDQLTSNLGLKDVELKKNSKTINSQKSSLQKLDNTNQGLVQDKSKIDEAMAKLQRELSDLNLKLNARDTEVQKLQQDNLTLSNAKTAALSNADRLESERQKSVLTLESMKHKLSKQASDIASRDQNIQNQGTTVSELLASQETTRLENVGLQTEIACANTKADSIQKLLDTRDKELGSSQQSSALKDKNIQRLETTNAELIQKQRKLDKEKKDLEHALENANVESKRLQAKLETDHSDLQVAREDAQHQRQKVDEVEGCLAAEKAANITASLQTLLDDTNKKVETISQALEKKTKCLADEESKNSTLRFDNDRLDRERCQLSGEKTILEQGQKELNDQLALEQATTQRLNKDVKSNSAVLDQLQQDKALLDTDRAYFLQQLMAESRRMYCVMEKLPKELVDVCDAQDLRIFSGVEAGETVLVRAQRTVEERKAFVVIERKGHMRVRWHKNFDRCKVYMVRTEWYLRLEEAPNEAPIDILITTADPYDLDRWMKRAD